MSACKGKQIKRYKIKGRVSSVCVYDIMDLIKVCKNTMFL